MSSHTRTASPRPHARHARHARNENEDETKPISRLRGVGQAGLAPPNLGYESLTLIGSAGGIYRRLGGARTACPSPRNREIGFVSSSFSFRVVRASGRGEAARAHVGGYPPRWASWVLVSRWSWPLGAQLLCTGMWVLRDFDILLDGRGASFVHTHVGFKRFLNLLI